MKRPKAANIGNGATLTENNTGFQKSRLSSMDLWMKMQHEPRNPRAPVGKNVDTCEILLKSDFHSLGERTMV